MDSDDWLFALFIANEERRWAIREAEEEREQLKEEYDEWCIDHGIPPPSHPEPEIHKGSGCLCLPAAVLFVVLCVIGALSLG